MNFLEEDQVILFPSDELLRAEAIASGSELLSQRLYAMGKLLASGKRILVTHPSALLRYLPSPTSFLESSIDLQVGSSFDLKDLRSKLVDIGYKGNNKVEHSLQFASRGDILDIFTVTYPKPIRIEFFGDEIESIRFFDVGSQRSLDKIKKVTIFPATDMLLSADQLRSFSNNLFDLASKDEAFLCNSSYDLKATAQEVVDSFSSHENRPPFYKYYGYALGESHSIIEYQKPTLIFFTNKEGIEESIKLLEKEATDYLTELLVSGRGFSALSEYMKIEEAVSNKNKVIFGSQFKNETTTKSFHVHRISSSPSSFELSMRTALSYAASNKRVVLCLNETNQKDMVKSYLDEIKYPYVEVEGFDLPEEGLAISSANLSEGFEIPLLSLAYISSRELFGQKTSKSRFTSRFRESSVLRSYEDLKPGDYIVHEYRGIGQFLDIKTMDTGGVTRDYLYVAYANNEFLYIPLEQFRLVRKYAGREGASPKLSSLSSGEWSKRKAKIKAKVNDLAERLLALYETRAKIEGFCFPKDDDLNKVFEKRFPYELTDDQKIALEDIKSDMEKPEVMDRLLCGDVGFGKTEVAFRAAFKAINAGKQVALLCPTTLLARQHYDVALQRFSGFDIEIALFSRLVPNPIQKKQLERVNSGKIHLVIGTHRLLSKDFKFPNLGLLIVDEEQRFGVEQKERIKEMSQSIDVLTLSATPIPRTLQMSLVGIRPLSEINTPPENRMPIQTYVTPFKESVVNELISRELARDGQVFYVYNRVDSIYNKASKLAASIPSSSIGVVHGQMEKEEIEDVMQKFYDGSINVLVCTSIVENGIDVPNANMIIVEDADKFGLSQLYQIKGRVGRGDRIAYAYLTYKEYKNMNEDAQKRLEAIQEFTELGSGYKIAQRDLMIRGAGDILGPEQAGFIDSIGLDLYMRMLAEAIETKKKGLDEAPPPRPVRLLDIDAYIPKGFASKEDKISLYQELEDLKTKKELDSFKAKLRDIYGRLPDEVELLLRKKKVDLLLDTEEISGFEVLDSNFRILLAPCFVSITGIGSDLFNELHPYLYFVKVGYINKTLSVVIKKRNDWLTDIENILNVIHSVYSKNKVV